MPFTEEEHDAEHDALVRSIERLLIENTALRTVAQALIAMERARNPEFERQVLEKFDETLGRGSEQLNKDLATKLRANLREIFEEPNIGGTLKPPVPTWRRLLGTQP